MKKLLTAAVVLLALVGVLLLSLPTILHKAGLHPEYNGPTAELPGKRALIITTSHGVLAAPGETEGPATGVMASEFTHPYYTFLDGGMASGGWGAAYDLAQSPELAVKVSEAYYGDKAAVIGGVCHGVLGLVNARARDGKLLIAGRRMTGVTDKQIKELDIEITPLHPETALREAGVIFESQTAFRDIFATHVTADDERRFVTGQNQNSGLETSNVMMQILAARTQ